MDKKGMCVAVDARQQELQGKDGGVGEEEKEEEKNGMPTNREGLNNKKTQVKYDSLSLSLQRLLLQVLCLNLFTQMVGATTATREGGGLVGQRMLLFFRFRGGFLTQTHKHTRSH